MLAQKVGREDLLWGLAAMCQLFRIPFDIRLTAAELVPPHTLGSLLTGAGALGFRAAFTSVRPETLSRLVLPAIILLRVPAQEAHEPDPAVQPDGVVTRLQPEAESGPPPPRVALLLQASGDELTYVARDTGTPVTVRRAAIASQLLDVALQFQLAEKPVEDNDAQAQAPRAFGFRWFVPELLRHKGIWRDVVFASLAIQLLGLAVPLFTQTIIDKVVVHQTMNTLVVLAIALAAIMTFSAGMSWVRQYLVLHTGNRVDAVLGSRVFEHLFALPPRYFEARPTGTLVARLHGVETIREFVSGAAVTLVLDLPFLGVFLAIMFFYSWQLTLIALGVLALITLLSLAIVPVLRARLNQQFLLGARNQAFLTEYIAGIATVKSLQMEPQLRARYGEFLASYLGATFRTRSLSNTFGTTSNLLEQLMTLAILGVGAWLVMQNDGFTIGMLVAFQMFAGRMAQPMLRLVGLWQEFQQAGIAVKRLGDIMDAPAEPYSMIPRSEPAERAAIEIEQLAFRYGDTRPLLYEDLSLKIPAGATVALMGPSGSGKSTLAKLLLGFYQPTAGAIRLNGTDIRHLSANELRSMFGVVPQETVLFAGTIYENLVLANPHATLAHVVRACRLAGIHETIERLPQGYQTPIGEHGVGLSGGQRQRIAIARALLKRPKILIFDEATANLDQDTAEEFGRTVSLLKGRVTMLFITHRLPSTLAVDAVVRLGGEGQQRAQVGER